MNEQKKRLEVEIKKMVADFQERNIETSIRVFITYSGEGKSFAFSYGGGDFYSQYGYVCDWVEQQKARTWQDQQRVDLDEDGERAF